MSARRAERTTEPFEVAAAELIQNSRVRNQRTGTFQTEVLERFANAGRGGAPHFIVCSRGAVPIAPPTSAQDTFHVCGRGRIGGGSVRCALTLRAADLGALGIGALGTRWREEPQPLIDEGVHALGMDATARAG